MLRAAIASTVALTLAASCKRSADRTPLRLLETVELEAEQTKTSNGVEFQLVRTGHQREANGACVTSLALHLESGNESTQVTPLWRHTEGALGKVVFQLTPAEKKGAYRVKLFRRRLSGDRPLSIPEATDVAQKEAKRLGCAVEDANSEGVTSYEGAVEPPLGDGCEISTGLYTGETVIHRGPSASR